MEQNNAEGSKKGSSLKSKVLRPVGATLIGLGTAFGSGIEAKSVSADDPTATVTRTSTPPKPTGTSTPTAREQEIAALQTAVAKGAKEREQDQQIANLQATATAQRETPTRTAAPPKPTETPIPAPTLNPADKEATREARQDDAYGKERARLEEEYKRTHPSSQPSVLPIATVKPGKPGGGDNNEGGFPWGWILGLGALTGGGWYLSNGERREKGLNTVKAKTPGWAKEAGSKIRGSKVGQWVTGTWGKWRGGPGGTPPAGPGTPPAAPPPAGP